MAVSLGKTLNKAYEGGGKEGSSVKGYVRRRGEVKPVRHDGRMVEVGGGGVGGGGCLGVLRLITY